MVYLLDLLMVEQMAAQLAALREVQMVALMVGKRADQWVSRWVEQMANKRVE